MPPAIITCRIGTCKCGCKGQNPHHDFAFKRVISNVKNERGMRTVLAFSSPVSYYRIGVARLPWVPGGKRVVVVEMLDGWYSTDEIVD